MTNKERFIELLRSTKREGIEKLIDFLEKTDFFTAPASTRFHMSCEGGLLQHSLNVYDCLVNLGTTTGDVQEFQTAGMRLDSIPQESIIIVALLPLVIGILTPQRCAGARMPITSGSSTRYTRSTTETHTDTEKNQS